MITTALAPGLSLWTADYEIVDTGGRREARGKLLRGKSVIKSFSSQIRSDDTFSVRTVCLPDRAIRFSVPDSQVQRRTRR